MPGADIIEAMTSGKSQHRRSLALCVLLCTGVVMVLRAVGFFYLLLLDFHAQDWITRYGRAATGDPRIAFLAIDQATQTLDAPFPSEIAASPALTLMREHGFPWPREVYPLIIERLVGAGAKVVAFDLLFPAAREDDELMRAGLDRFREHVVVGCNITDIGDTVNLALPTATLIPQTRPVDPRVGFVNFWSDLDGVVRRAYFRRSLLEIDGRPAGDDDSVLESLAARAARQAGLTDLIPADRKSHILRYASGDGSLTPHSLYGIFVPSIWHGNFGDGAFFKDKIVVVGPEGHAFKDLALSPLGQIGGPMFHLNSLNALLRGEFLSETSERTNLLLIAACGLLSGLLGWLVRQPLLRVFLLAAAAGTYIALAFVFFNAGTYLLVASPLLALVGSGGAFSIVEQVLERLEKSRIRRQFESFVSRDVVKELLDNPDSYLNTIGGRRKNITVFFSDIRGFTTITESADAQQLVQQLNEYFTEMVRIVFAHRGTLDKFIGDAVMAHWGSLTSDGEEIEARRAVAAALEMRAALERLNTQWKSRALLELRVGMAVNHGEAIVGKLGSDEKREFTAIGDAVNLTSRLEGATKAFHTDLLIGEKVAPLIRDAFVLRTVDLLQVAGRNKPVQVFTVLSSTKCDPPPWLARYEEGVRLYRARDFAGAITAFSEMTQALPDDWLAEEYLRRAMTYAATPPDADWDGVFVMGTK